MGQRIHDPIITGAPVYQGEPLATAEEINATSQRSSRQVLLAADTALNAEEHADRTLIVATNSPILLTLPVGILTGLRFRILVFAASQTSPYHRIQRAAGAVANLVGNSVAVNQANNAATHFAANAADLYNTITLNPDASGGQPGDLIELEATIGTFWHVRCTLQTSGVSSNPFSNVT